MRAVSNWNRWPSTAIRPIPPATFASAAFSPKSGSLTPPLRGWFLLFLVYSHTHTHLLHFVCYFASCPFELLTLNCLIQNNLLMCTLPGRCTFYFAKISLLVERCRKKSGNGLETEIRMTYLGDGMAAFVWRQWLFESLGFLAYTLSTCVFDLLFLTSQQNVD